MATVTVFRVQIYDAAQDSLIVSRRMATRQGIEIMRGQAIAGSDVEIDESLLEYGEQWTPIDFDPTPRFGFPNFVKP